MFEQIKNYFLCTAARIKNVKIEDMVTYENMKMSIVVDCVKYMASFEILDDYTYDFIVIEMISENLVTSKTKKFNNIDDLFKEIDKDLAFLRDALCV